MATKTAAVKPKAAARKTAPEKGKPAAVKPVKKTVSAKTKPAAKKAQVKSAAKSVNKKGAKYSCAVCGLVVSVDTVCNCVDVCDLICCSKPMKVARK